MSTFGKRTAVWVTALAMAATPLASPSLHAIGAATAVAPQIPANMTLKVTIVVSRWEGEKKIGSLPFVLMVVPGIGNDGRDGDTVSLQMGSDYPVPSWPVTDGKTAVVPSYQYRQIGTNINVAARLADEPTRFNVMVNVQDSQVLMDAPVPGTGKDGMPRFQNFRTQNRLILRDGQTVQYTAASDKLSGEMVKLDVTINVLK